MITITNRKHKIILDDKYLKRDKGNLNYVGEDPFNEIVISFVYKKKLFKYEIKKVQKCLASAGYSAGDVLKEYQNHIASENEVVLNDDDYKEVAKFIKTLQTKDTKRKGVIINAYANLVAYECYRYFVLSELEDEVDINFIFNSVCSSSLYFSEKRKYKKEIIQKARNILKKEYDVNLDYIFDGGSKNE